MLRPRLRLLLERLAYEAADQLADSPASPIAEALHPYFKSPRNHKLILPVGSPGV